VSDHYVSCAPELKPTLGPLMVTSLQAGKWLPFLALTFSGIGVVYGDIGTSFIYVFPSVFTDTPSEDDIIGAVSLVIWTITTLVLVKYALLVLRADDNGQG
jgi:K+ transporter